MSRYVVGDVQGCHAELMALLRLVGFDPRRDVLWLVGDLVNRGPESLEVLRTVRELGNAAVSVLGNHDFHLLTVASGHRRMHADDTLQAVLDAPDRDGLLAWLAARPLVVRDGDVLMVHAGLLPSWTPTTAQMLSREVEAVLQSGERDRFLGALYGDQPLRWRDDLQGYDRLRVVVNACTRMRFCAADDTMELKEKRGPAHAPRGYAPWYAHPERKSAQAKIVCGHWSTHELLLAPNVSMLDTGCLWGGTLTALRLEDRRLFQVPSRFPLWPAPRE